MTIRFAAKVPGTQMEIRDVNMDFGYGHSFTEESPKPTNASSWTFFGEPPLFPRHEEVELSWKILDPFEEYWEENRIKPEPYESGSGSAFSARNARTRQPRLEAPVISHLHNTTVSAINKELEPVARQQR